MVLGEVAREMFGRALTHEQPSVGFCGDRCLGRGDCGGGVGNPLPAWVHADLSLGERWRRVGVLRVASRAFVALLLRGGGGGEFLFDGGEVGGEGGAGGELGGEVVA